MARKRVEVCIFGLGWVVDVEFDDKMGKSCVLREFRRRAERKAGRNKNEVAWTQQED